MGHRDFTDPKRLSRLPPREFSGSAPKDPDRAQTPCGEDQVSASLTVNCRGSSATVLEIEPGRSMRELTGPAGITIRKPDSGEHLVVVSGWCAHHAPPGDEDVTVAVLPARFEAGGN